MLAQKKKIPGFGHRVYHTEDPRATHLRRMSQDLGQSSGNAKWFEISRKIEEFMVAERKLNANVDFYSASTYHTLGIDIDLFTPVFAVSRVSGWTAHVIEQLNDNRLIRPRADYHGPGVSESLRGDGQEVGRLLWALAVRSRVKEIRQTHADQLAAIRYKTFPSQTAARVSANTTRRIYHRDQKPIEGFASSVPPASPFRFSIGQNAVEFLNVLLVLERIVPHRLPHSIAACPEYPSKVLRPLRYFAYIASSGCYLLYIQARTRAEVCLV